MPEKKTGVFDMIMGVFRGKKEIYGDIVAEAEKVVAGYIDCRKSMIINKYRKKSRFMSVAAIGVMMGILFLIYRLV